MDRPEHQTKIIWKEREAWQGEKPAVSSLPSPEPNGAEWDQEVARAPPLRPRAAAQPVVPPAPPPPRLPECLEREGDELGRWRDSVSRR